MNLSELAAFICTKINQSETEDLAACKQYLTARAKMLWNVALWKDSLVSFEQTLSSSGYTVSSTWLPTKGVLLCPTIIERVVAARLDSRRLSVQRQEYYYCIDYDSFAKSGQVTEFVLLPPCVWEWNTAQAVKVQRNDSANSAAVVRVDYQENGAITTTRAAVTLTEEINDVATSERIDAISKATTTGSAVVGTASTSYGPDLAGGTYAGGHRYPELEIGATYLYTQGNSTDLTVDFQTIAPGEFVAAASTADLSGPAGEAVTATIRKVIPSVTGVTIAASDTAALKRQRIRLLQIPTESTTIRVLGKRTMPTFESDLDTPPINGMENCLLAFAHADMLQRERQYGKARELQEEAIGLLDQLKDLEVVQQAHNISIQPGSGFVSEYNFNSGLYHPLSF